MKYIIGFFMAWGMFTSIPCPVKKWDDALREYMLSMFPIIGLLIGILYAVLLLLVKDMGQAMRTAVLTAFPWVITGFIHIDGFMDVCDAVLSRRNLEGKIRILKDSVCGAFAVVCMVLLALFQFSVIFDAEINNIDILALICVLCTSRSCASIAVGVLKPISQSQYNGMLINKRCLIVPVVFLVLSIAAPVVFCGNVAAVVTAVVYFIFAILCYREFRGFNGDVSGFSLTLSELAGLFVVMTW